MSETISHACIMSLKDLLTYLLTTEKNDLVTIMTSILTEMV